MNIVDSAKEFPPTVKGANGDYIVIMGRGFIRYFNKNHVEFYINSEMLISSEYSISVFGDDIKPINSDSAQLTKTGKLEILNRVLELCELGGIRVKVE